jgi:hypothetical protein
VTIFLGRELGNMGEILLLFEITKNTIKINNKILKNYDK